MSEKTLGVAVSGVGWAGTQHLRSFEANPHTRVVAIVGRSKERAEEQRAALGLDCACYGDFEEMLKRDDVDIVTIATPNNLHAREATLAAQAGKHIAVEKPIALNEEELQELEKAVRKAGVKSTVYFVLRWHPIYLNIRSLLDKGVLGRLFYSEVDFMFGLDESVPSYPWTIQEKYTGSSLLTGGCHAVDGLRYCMGQEPVEVHALYAKGWNEAFDYPATAVFMARFPDGSVGKVISSLESQMPYRFRVGLLGSEGSLFDNELYSKKLFPGQQDFATVPCTMLRSGETSGHPYPQVVENLVNAILEDRSVGLDIFDAAKTHRVIFAADESAATGKPVALSL